MRFMPVLQPVIVFILTGWLCSILFFPIIAPFKVAANPDILIRSQLIAKNNVISITSEVPTQISSGEDKANENDFLEKYIASHFLVSNKENPCGFDFAAFSSTETLTKFSGEYVCDTNINSIDHLLIKNALYAEILPQSNHNVDIILGNEQRNITFTPQKRIFPTDFLSSEPLKLTLPNEGSVEEANNTSDADNSKPVNWKFYIAIGSLIIVFLTIAGYFLNKKRR